MNKLPKDVWLIILSYIRCYDDFVALNRTCSVFHSMIKDKNFFQRYPFPRKVLRFQSADVQKRLKIVEELLQEDSKFSAAAKEDWKKYQNRCVKIVFAGNTQSGKTALMTQIVANYFTNGEYDPTIEPSYRKQIQIHNTGMIIDCLKTEGPGEIWEHRQNEEYYRECDSLVICMDTTQYIEEELIEHIVQHCRRAKDIEEYGQILLTGTKMDDVSNRCWSIEDGRSLAKKIGAGYVETSSKTRENVEDLYIEAAKLGLMSKLAKKEEKKKSGGCILN